MRDPTGSNPNTPSQQPPRRAARKAPRRRRPVLILLNLLIIALAVTGVYLIAEPYFLHWRQDRKTAELIQAVEKGDGTIVLSADELKVPGEQEEFVEQVEEWDIEATEPADPANPAMPSGNPGETGTTGSTGSAAQPAGTKGPTPTPRPTQPQVVIQAIGQLLIDKIDLKMPIADRAESAQLRVAVGLLGGSAMPGTPGNAIILGHRMYTYGRHFNRLDEVTAGASVVIVTKAGRRITYTVDRQETILPADLRRALSQPTKDKQLILVTCTPVRIASHRLLVYCRQVSDQPA